MQTIAVKHNIEVAHRLFELPGKCENIHGHSMWVTMHLGGEMNDKGILGGIEFGDLKKMFRSYLDDTYDHRVLLNLKDPFAQPIMQMKPIWTGVEGGGGGAIVGVTAGGGGGAQITQAAGWVPTQQGQTFLPGLQTTPGDPTTENIARWVADDMRMSLEDIPNYDMLSTMTIEVWETSVNMASYAVML